MGLLERDAELEKLSVALDSAVLGSGRVVLVRGEAGIGKTTLVRSFLEASSDRAEFLVGVCDDLFTPRPLSPLWDMSRDEPAIDEALVGVAQSEFAGSRTDGTLVPNATSPI